MASTFKVSIFFYQLSKRIFVCLVFLLYSLQTTPHNACLQGSLDCILLNCRHLGVEQPLGLEEPGNIQMYDKLP